MQWFRSHSRSSAWAGLFAIALQLALSFGHFHFEPATALPDSATTALAAQAAAIAISKPDRGDDEAPVQADHFCAICALIHLTNSVFFSTAPAIAAPVVFAQAQFALQVE